MPRIVFVVLILLVSFPSCRSRREYTSSALDEELIRKIEYFIQQRDSIVSSRKEIYHLNECVEIIERQFDTTHAPDSLGNYPVINEKITNINKKGDSIIEEDKKQVSDTDIAVEDNSKEKKKQDVVVDNEVKENKSFTYLIWFSILVVVVIILVFLKQLGIFRKSC